MSKQIAQIISANYSTAAYTALSLTSVYVAYRFLYAIPNKPMIPTADMKNVVILGGSHAGITTAHKLLKLAAPGTIKVTMVSPNTHLYWNIASVRAIVPGGFPDDKLFQPIAPGFKQFTADQFEFVIGKAEGLDVEAKKVTISSKAGTTTLGYDILVLATGAHCRAPAPWKILDSYEETRDTLHEYQNKVKEAKSIVVVGGGSTGVETAGEIGYEYGKAKQITLITGSDILEGTPASVKKAARSLLKNVNVTVKEQSKIVGDAKMPNGQTELTLASGEKIVTDLYLPTTGLVPNSSFIPAKFLNSNGFVIVDNSLQVKGAQDIWAAGDISAIQRPQVVNAAAQSGHVAKNIVASLKGGSLANYKIGPEMAAFPIGRKAGTGHMGQHIKFPSFMVVFIKGKTYFTERLPTTIIGTAW